MTTRLKSTAATLGRVLLSLVLLGALAWLFRDKLNQSFALIAQARVMPLVWAAFWYVVFIVISSWRWQVLLSARQLRFNTFYLARVFTISLFFCKLLPTSIGGDVMRIAYTAPRDRVADAFSATLLDRLIGFTSLLFLAVVVSIGLFASSAQSRSLELVVLGIRFAGPGILLLLCAGLLALVFVTLAFFSDRVHRLANRVFGRMRLLRLGERLDRAYDAVKQFRNHRLALATSFVSGIGVQATLALSWYSVTTAIGGTVPAVYYLIFIPLLNIVVNIPTIGGLGVREWAFVLFFTPQWLTGHLTQELALATALLFLALDLVFALAGGLLFAATKRRTADQSGLRSDPIPKEDGNVTHSQTEP
ncbi:MAG: lysylphosphatidylglycerol synthase transmembrane domain-containing protein [candidate division WOR-3 bacterium]